MAKLAFDTGGTFTDFALTDDHGTHPPAQGAVDARRTRPRPCIQGVGELLAARRTARPRREDLAGARRHDGRHQRGAGAQGRRDRLHHHRRLPGHAADPQRGPLRPLRPEAAVPRAAGAARPLPRHRRARHGATAPSSRPSTRTACAEIAAQAEGRGHRLRRGLPAARLQASAARAAHRRAPGRRRARPLRVALVRASARRCASSTAPRPPSSTPTPAR